MSDFAAKGNAYDVPNLRVDGNDPLAVYAVTKKAWEDTAKKGPTLIEAITWRLGFHTSSDNPDLYRHSQENELWKPWEPIQRMRKYLALADWWNDSDEDELQKRCVDQIQAAVEAAEKMDIPGPDSQFDDVFENSHWMLDEQRERLLAEVSGEDIRS
jgi:TPP-dependent pyruvate/acetoin dehydrogenase alpha subunit